MRKLFAFVLVAVAAFAQNLPGNYSLVGVHEVGSELLLKPDGSFEYMLAYGAADYSAAGKWRRGGEAVILNTNPITGPPFRLIRSAAVEGKGINVWVKAPNGVPVPHIDVVIQTSAGKVEGRTGDHGGAWFPDVQKASAVRLGVRVYDLEAGPYPVDEARNDFTFEINAPAITTVPFKEEPLKINGRNLELRYWQRDKAMIYEKQ